MKILKKATQKNVLLNNAYYTLTEVNEMLVSKEIGYFDDELFVKHDALTRYEFDNTQLRIFTDDIEELKVALDEYGSYTTIAIGKNGKKYFVEL